MKIHAIFLLFLAVTGVSNAVELPTHFRRPVAAVFTADESHLVIANGRSGTVSILDVARREIIAEHKISEQLADLVTHNGTDFVACDTTTHEVIRFSLHKNRLTVVERILVSKYPVGLAVNAKGERIFVSSLWSRRVSSLQIEQGKPTETAFRVDTKFAPRKMLLVEDDAKLVVADSHGGTMATLATGNGAELARVEIPGHNIRGMAVSHSGEKIVVAHQMLNDLAHTARNDVHWGLLLSNDLRWLPLTSITTGKPNVYDGAHMHPLGEAGSATSDPAAIAVAADGTTIVCLAGVDEISFGKEDDFSLRRAKVGKRPTAIVVDKAGKFACIVNTFGDSVSVFNVKELKTVAEISLGPSPKLTAVDRGEFLFYDARLSHDNWMSCNSCHTDGHSGGLLNDNLSDGGFGAPKRVLSLLGKNGTEPFAWNAEAEDYQTQIRNSITKTMQSDEPPSDETVADLAAYLRTLPPPPSISQARDETDIKAVEAGKLLFASLNCKRCHSPESQYTTPRTYNVKLEDEAGNTRFNPPSLIGVGQRETLFHDGRAKSLQDVLQKHRHQLKRSLTDTERKNLIEFLKSL